MANRELAPWGRSRGLSPRGRDPFTSLHREVDRLFDDFLGPAEARSFGSPPATAAAIWPSLDVDETEQGYRVTAELPGLELKDVDLQLSDNVLTIKGEKRSEMHDEKGGRTYSERSYGRFERTVPFDTEVDPDQVQARFKNGVLTVELPKNPRAQEKARKIEIRPD
jgi:HSP20 family protein